MNNKQNPAKKKKKLPVGTSDFKKLRETGYYYVDKSLFAREITEASAEVLLIPRPRRFGKTLNLSMLRYFYEKSDENQGALFDGLAVRDDEVWSHQGKYPVIFLTFKDIKGNTWDDLYEGLRWIISREVERHSEILKQDEISATARNHLVEIINGRASRRLYENSLLILSEQLKRCHNKRVVILLDEYDTPIHSGYLSGCYNEIISFMRNFLSGGLKDNENLFRGVVTGILRVAKESVFSGLNNLGVYTLLSPTFSDSFGFTEAEVRTVLEDCGMSDLYDKISYWYNGYQFGKTVIYNPWSVANCLDNQGDPRPYWVNTADSTLIDRLVTKGGSELREEIGCLLEGGTVTKPVYDSIVMKDLEKRDDLLWSFMLFSGYLKFTHKSSRRNYYELEIPNEEVHIVYEEMIERWFAEKIGLNQLEEMLKALGYGDVNLFERLLREIVLQVMSYHDLSGSPEKVYHALVLGMLVWLSDKYEIRSNRESGYGRYDLMLKPKEPGRQGIVIEFKKVYENDTPEEVLDAALKQIEDKKYAAELEASGIKDILKLAVAFQGKELWVKQENTSG